MDKTLKRIHELANERYRLYLSAGHKMLTSDQRSRLHQLDNQLADLWDTHRREVASRSNPVHARFTAVSNPAA